MTTKSPGWLAHAFGRPSTRPRYEEDPLQAFELERPVPSSNLAPSPAPRNATLPWRWPTRFLTLGAGLILLLLTAGAIFAMRGSWTTQGEGRLTIETRPAGTTVLVNGRDVGTTPLTTGLPAGEHRIVLRRGDEERQLPITLAAGAQVTHYLEFATPDPPAAVQGGRISVVTDPPGARVQVDGVARGVAPITIGELAPSEHTVAVTSATGSAKRTISVERGATTSVVFSLVSVEKPMAGWLAFSAPADLQISENNEVIATGRSARIMLPTGRHTIKLSSQALQYEETRQVEVVAGKTGALQVELPKVSVNVNARPWADVTIDGVNAGQTPISSLPVTIGSHDVVFRHPQFGERRRAIVVTMRGENRIAVDLTQP